MTATFEDIREAMVHLPKGDKVRLLALFALDVTDSYPGIDFADHVCGGAARVVRTRIPVWTLEAARRQGMSDAAILTAFPSLTAEDLANAWHYTRSHREEISAQVSANEDD
jgi:uncharacterized protein (DUF433 family)